jgi:hypothetical protein
MHELRSADLPDPHLVGSTSAPDRPRPSRWGLFLVYGSISVALFAVAASLHDNDDRVLASVSDFSCLGASLSGVAAAIYGCVTLTRAVRR